MFSNTQQPSKFGTLLGSTTAPSGGLFGSTTSQPQPQQPRQSLFGGSLAQAPGATAPNIFGGSQVAASQQQQQPQQSLFGGSIQQQQQQQSQGPQLPPLRSSVIAQGLSTEKPLNPRDKPILDQMGMLYKKWNPMDPNCVLEGYVYNTVKEDDAWRYHPTESEDSAKWEEALAKKPFEDSMPLLLRGFGMISARITQQDQAVQALSIKMHEINDALGLLIQNHDLKIQVKCNEAKNRHNEYTQRIVKLAAKVQILRNRGYAMDSTEEELKKKLMELEKKAFDPILGGKQEEIWARMSAARARAQILQRESEKLGQTTQTQDGSALNDEEQKQVRKVLEDYDAQLTHLKKEIDTIRKDYEEWEKAQKPATTK